MAQAPVPGGQIGPAWVPLGPASTVSGQVTVPPNNEISGAINALAIHPTNPDITYIGAVNGGIWRTANATATSPTWTPLTDNLSSQSIGALEFDPTDPTYQTLVAGSGRLSSYGAIGPARIGVLRTTDGGNTWSVLGTSMFVNENLMSIAARGTVILAASDSQWGGGNGSGVFRSTSTGASFSLVSGTAGLAAGPVSDMVGDPGNPSRFFAVVRTVGIFRSDDTGATWTNVTNNLTGISASTYKVEMAMFNNGTTTALYAGVLNSTALQGVWRSTDLGATWTQMDTPVTGGQTNLHFSIATDRTNPALVYVGGQSGRFRGDATLSAGSQFTSLHSPNSGGTTPHADSREMFCDSAGTLVETSDGGIYRRALPSGNTSPWVSGIGNLAVFEAHNIAYDSVNHVAMIGTQDNGTQIQSSSASTVWTGIYGGDGADVAIDDTSSPGQSIRYGSSQNLGGFFRKTYNSSNTLVSTVYPTLTVLNSGPAIGVQFVTPVELNKVDPTRMIIGGSNAAYESLNRGDTVTALTPNSSVNGTFTSNPIAYGGWLNGVPNPDILYYGSGSTVKIRTTAGGAAASTAAAFPGGTVQDIVLDRNDYRRVFVTGSSSIYFSPDSGATWQNITGDLTGVGSLHTLEFFKLYGTDCVAVGTDIGVYCSFVGNLGVWNKLGTGLPNALVNDMTYNPTDSVLVISTMGRSTFLLPVSAAPLTYLTVSLSSSVVTEGAAPVTATLTATPAPTSDLTVTLSSSDTGEATVPASVTILASQTTATFPVTVIDDALVDGTQVANITASAAGYTDGVAALTVQDNETATLTVTVPATTIEGAGTVQGTVTMSSPAGKAVTVSLSSSDTTAVTVPATMTIAAGQMSGNFTINVVDDNKIDGTQNATITAHVANWTDGSANIAVPDNENYNLALALPASVTEAGTGTGTVSISGTLTTTLVVSLSSDTTSRLTVPATATILAGNTSATFTLTAPNNSLTDGNATVTISASASGFIGTNATTTVVDNDVHHYVFPAVSSPQTRGAPFSVTVTAQNINSQTITGYTGTATLTASGASGADSILPTTTTAFTAGVWTGNVTVNTFDTSVVLTASDGAGHTGSSNAFNSGTGALHHFAWNTQGARATNAALSATITAQDAGNNTVTSFTGTAALSGYAGNSTGSTVVVSELDTGDNDAIEFTNVSSSARDISGWKVTAYDWNSWPAPSVTFTIPNGTVCAANQVFLLRENGTAPGTFPAFYTGVNIYWNNTSTGNPVALLLQDAAGNVVDFVCAFDAVPSQITSPISIPAAQWTGSPIAANTDTTKTFLRTGSSDTNSSANWATGTPSLGTLNTGLITPFPSSTVAVPVSPAVSGIFSGGIWTGSMTVAQTASQMRFRADDGASHTGDSNAFDVTGTLTLSIPASAPENSPPVTGTVSVSSAPVGDLVVMLTSSDPASATVPATVTIPSGQTSATFLITPIDDLIINGTRVVTITAHLSNWTDATANISILDNETTSLALFLPASVGEGSTATATVSASGAVPGNLTVSLVSNNTSRLTVPATVTIPSGSSSATFTLTGVDNSLTDGNATVNVAATASGYTGANANTTVLDNDVHHFSIATIASPQTKGVPFNVSITAYEIGGGVITTYGGTPGLTASGAGGANAISPANASGFVNGVWTGQITSFITDTNVVITVSDGAGHTGTGNAFNVINPTSVLTVVESVTPVGVLQGQNPRAQLIVGADGALYGTTQSGGSSNQGTVFKISTAGVMTPLANFYGVNGMQPYAGLILASDGNFYGTTSAGGASNLGTIFKMTPSGVLTTLVNLSSATGTTPKAPLVQASDGNFYGTASAGGSSGSGTIFKVTPSGVLTVLVNFTGTTNTAYGSSCQAGLIQANDGNLYGVTSTGGSGGGFGTIFKVTTGGTFTSLASFTGTTGSVIGAAPLAALVQASDGSLYGNTNSGGSGNAGTVFKVTTGGAFTNLLSFTGFTGSFLGSSPQAALVQWTDGNLYGTTSTGGTFSYGTIFKVTTAGVLTTLRNLSFATDGQNPTGALVLASDGNFYGTATFGGAQVSGMIFSISPSTGTFTGKFSFIKSPQSFRNLIQASDGNFYGGTAFGNGGNNSVFKLTPSGVLSTLATFTSFNSSAPNVLEGS
ncbi:MAG: choice-of-anchor tandem repeat GloVer-containing protein, partial [Chthoniobacteraceae bacterium]